MRTRTLRQYIRVEFRRYGIPVLVMPNKASCPSVYVGTYDVRVMRNEMAMAIPSSMLYVLWSGVIRSNTYECVEKLVAGILESIRKEYDLPILKPQDMMTSPLPQHCFGWLRALHFKKMLDYDAYEQQRVQQFRNEAHARQITFNQELNKIQQHVHQHES